jgi:uncharacterized protein (TIGR00725 family)
LAMAYIVVGVMGPGEAATEADCRLADRLGELIAEQGWVILTGGRPVGVMQAALVGAKRHGGLTVGVLPRDTPEPASEAVDIPIVTGMGEARNVVNVLTSRVVFVCGMSTGTASEVALALKADRPTILVNAEPSSIHYWQSMASPCLRHVATAEEAVRLAAQLLEAHAVILEASPLKP